MDKQHEDFINGLFKRDKKFIIDMDYVFYLIRFFEKESGEEYNCFSKEYFLKYLKNIELNLEYSCIDGWIDRELEDFLENDIIDMKTVDEKTHICFTPKGLEIVENIKEQLRANNWQLWD